jgi:CspA family cold shock protein
VLAQEEGVCFNSANKYSSSPDSFKKSRTGAATICILSKQINKMTGKIARVTDRGFGFITPDDGQKDVFFHAKDLNGVEFNDLKEGEMVTFDIVDGPKGPAAANVSRA